MARSQLLGVGTYDLRRSYFPGMAFLVEADVAVDPMQVAFNAAVGVMPGVESLAHLGEQLFTRGLFGRFFA